MLDIICSGCAAVAVGVKMLTDVLQYIIRVNYELVATVIEVVTHFVTSVLYVYGQFRQYVVTVSMNTIDIFLEVYIIFTTFTTSLWKSVTSLYKFLQICYANVISVCLSCANYMSTCFLMLTYAFESVRDFLDASVDMSVSLIIAVISTIFLVLTTLGSYCVHFVAGAWQGLGFVLSSVALFPAYFIQGVKNMWTKTIESFASVVTVTTKETYLGIVVMCLLYLTLSNTFRYLYSRGLSLFPHRIHRRRTRENAMNWQFDRGFESDFEDLYSSDAEDFSWVTPMEANNNTIEDSDVADTDVNDHDSNNSDNISDDDDSDSEEYTVVTEESDSDASINSQTFSTESSDHEIEVQLPPLDKRFNLCSRSSTPSRLPKTVSSPEEFDREMERERDKRKCVICQDQIKSVLVLPCKHMCMCVICADQIVRSRTIGRRVCPLCRTRIGKVMNVYV